MTWLPLNQVSKWYIPEYILLFIIGNCPIKFCQIWIHLVGCCEVVDPWLPTGVYRPSYAVLTVWCRPHHTGTWREHTRRTICTSEWGCWSVHVSIYLTLYSQGMPSDQLRSHLVLMSQALNQAVQLISKEKITVSVVCVVTFFIVD